METKAQFKKDMKIYAVVDGKIKKIENVADIAFSKKMLGDGMAIEPSSNLITSPCEGKVAAIYPTKHFIGIKMADNEELLIHIGIDTAELNGDPFETKVSVGDDIEAGTVLCRADFDFMAEKGYITDVIVISSTSRIKIVKTDGAVNRNDVIFETLK
ncbi:MAG: PTS glucose transporter subunit IIA [Streptococcaceae bacterium]|nr:PTS glucose transporter subunit IIA [Streptococcaceae bacterium]